MVGAIEAQKAAECSQNLMAEAPQKTAVAPPLLKKSQVGQGDAGSDDQHEGKAKVCSRRSRLLFWAAVLLSLLVVGGVVLVVKFPEVLGRDGATQVQTRHYVLGPRRGQYHDLSLDDPSVPDETRLPPSEWQLRSAANAQQPRKPGQGRSECRLGDA